jgi:hypothetical protein
MVIKGDRRADQLGSTGIQELHILPHVGKSFARFETHMEQ